ncbi:MAG: zinc-ribbon domain-containing protein [Candidatus Thorarchaeota archaeon]
MMDPFGTIGTFFTIFLIIFIIILIVVIIVIIMIVKGFFWRKDKPKVGSIESNPYAVHKESTPTNCPNCGKELELNEKYCSECGSEI